MSDQSALPLPGAGRVLIRGGVRRYGPVDGEGRHDALPEFWLDGWRNTCSACSRPIVRKFPWVASWRHDWKRCLPNDWLVEPTYSDEAGGRNPSS